MLIYSMSVSVDGFIADRDGAFGWSVPSDELFRFHLDQVRGLGSCLLGRRLYETMLVWETDPSLRDNEDTDAFADVWSAPPHSTRPTRTSRSAAPAWPRRRSSSASSTSCACSAIRSSSVSARRSCRRSPKTSRWT